MAKKSLQSNYSASAPLNRMGGYAQNSGKPDAQDFSSLPSSAWVGVLSQVNQEMFRAEAGVSSV